MKRGSLIKAEAREEKERRELHIKKRAKQGYDVKDVITKDKNKFTVSELLKLWLITKRLIYHIKHIHFMNLWLI